MTTLGDASAHDLEQRLTSVTEHLTAIEATISALAVALGAESNGKRSADVAQSLRDFVSPQLCVEIGNREQDQKHDSCCMTVAGTIQLRG